MSEKKKSNAELVEEAKHPAPVRERPDKAELLAVNLDENSKFLQNSLTLFNLPDINTDDPQQVAERCGFYFDLMNKTDTKPSMAGLALALGVDRLSLYNWVRGLNAKPKEVVNVLKKCVQILNANMEDWMQNGKINPVSGIFLMKNSFGYRDQQEMVITPNNPLGEQKDREALERKYLEGIPDSDE